MVSVTGLHAVEPQTTFEDVVAPVRLAGGIAGALSVIGPTYRIDQDTMHRYGHIVAIEAAELSTQLGALPDGQETRP